MADSPTTARRWLFGPLPDLLFGCGLAYFALFLGFVFLGSNARGIGWMVSVPFLTLILSAPHYGATLLRVYERRADRRAYAVFAVWFSLALAALFVLGVHQILVGSLIVTLYLTWVPWHYSGQNYGLAVMFLRRRGVAFDEVTKRLLHASFVLSYGLAFLALHSTTGTTQYAPIDNYDPTTYRLIPLGIPSTTGDFALVGIGTACLACLGLALVRLRRRASLRDLAPTLLLVGMQALWFTLPILVRRFDLLSSVDPLASRHGDYYFLWIAIAHAVQYVWVTAHYAKTAGNWGGFGVWFTKALLAGAAIWTVPGLLFAPDALGRLPYDAGLGGLVASAVNLHHFVLDGAIWKLRSNRVASVLIRDAGAGERGAPVGEPARGFRPGSLLRPAVWAVGALSIFVLCSVKWEEEVGVRQAANAGDLPRFELAIERLERLGRDSATRRYLLAQHLARGDPMAAAAEFERSLELLPSAAAWVGLGRIHEREGRHEEALRSYRDALALDPELAVAWHRAGVTHLELGQPAAAAESLERAVTLDPDQALYRRSLARARRVLEEEAAAR